MVVGCSLIEKNQVKSTGMSSWFDVWAPSQWSLHISNKCACIYAFRDDLLFRYVSLKYFTSCQSDVRVGFASCKADVFQPANLCCSLCYLTRDFNKWPLIIMRSVEQVSTLKILFNNSYLSVFKQINVISGSLSDGLLQLHFINRYHSISCR